MKDIYHELHLKNREDVVLFLKSLWREEPMACPVCGGKLDYLHKKAKKSNNDWFCTECGKKYDAIDILNQI